MYRVIPFSLLVRLEYFFLLLSLLVGSSYAGSLVNDLKYTIIKNYVFIDGAEEGFRLCKNSDGSIQRFSFYINEDGSVGALVAFGYEIDNVISGSHISETSLCNGENKTTGQLSGLFEINKSYIVGGVINSEFGIEHGFREADPKVTINESNLNGDFKIYQNVKLYKFSLTGDPFLFGKEGDGIDISNSVINYSVQSGEQAKGVYGSVKMDNVYGNGNFDFQSYNDDSLLTQTERNIVDPVFDIQLFNIGTKEEPKLNGFIVIRNKVTLYRGSYKGPLKLDGNVDKGINISESNLDFSGLPSGDYDGINGSVSFNKVTSINKNISVFGKKNIISAVNNSNIKKYIGIKKLFPASFQKTASEYAVALSGDNDIGTNLVIGGNIAFKNQVSIYSSKNLKGNFTIDGNRGEGVSIYSSSIEYNSPEVPEKNIKGYVNISNSTIQGNPEIIGAPILVDSIVLKDLENISQKLNLDDKESKKLLENFYRVDINNTIIKQNPEIKGNVKIGSTTTIDGNFKIWGASLIDVESEYDNYIYASTFNQIDQNLTPEIKGFFYINTLTSTGSPKIDGSTKIPGVKFLNSKINGNPEVKYRILIQNVDINNDPIIHGYNESTYINNSMLDGYPERITLNGTNKLSGLYSINKSLTNATIEALDTNINGAPIIIGAGAKSIGSNITLKGIVRIYDDAVIGSDVKITGTYLTYPDCNDCYGVTVNLGSEITGPTTDITGFIYFGNSKIRDSQINIFQPTYIENRWSRIHNCTVSGSSISGSIYVDGGTITGQTISGHCGPSGCEGGGPAFR